MQVHGMKKKKQNEDGRQNDVGRMKPNNKLVNSG